MNPTKENSALQGAALSSQLYPNYSSHNTTSQELCNAALALAARNRPVFPLVPKGKKPLTQHGLKDASADPVKIKYWWQNTQPANIGMVTGSVSGVWVLDIDGEEGEQSLRTLTNRYAELPSTAESITGGGGRHIFFLCPKELTIPNSAGRLGAGLDVRGNGGYVVMPPSVHESGRKYAWSVDSGGQILPAPEWLIKLISSSSKAQHITPVAEWRRLIKAVPEGQRNQSLACIAGKLLRSWIDPYMALELCLAWNATRCEPPLSQDEVARTVNSIAGRELSRRGG